MDDTVLNMKELVWMYENAPVHVQDSVTRTLFDSVANAYVDYTDAIKNGMFVQLELFCERLLQEVAAVSRKDMNYVFTMRSLATLVYNKYKACNGKNIYVVCCIYETAKDPRIVFVSESGYGTATDPAVYCDDEKEYEHKVSNLLSGVKRHYRVIYLSKRGVKQF